MESSADTLMCGEITTNGKPGAWSVINTILKNNSFTSQPGSSVLLSSKTHS